jgi:hypothetical protein
MESTTTAREHINTIMLQTIGAYPQCLQIAQHQTNIRFLHAVAGFPVEETWLKAIRWGNNNSWPLINVTNVSRYIPESEETQKRHMQRQQQGVRSTKKKALDVSPNTPTPPPHESKRDVLICIYKLKETMYSNQMGLFLQVSSLGNKYIMVIHDVNSNSLWVEALKNNTGSKLILGCVRALACMRKVDIIPKHQVLDNQALAVNKKAIGNLDMTFELVPPDDHRHNMAEKAIQTFKDHFVGILSGCALFSFCTSGANFPTGGAATSSPPTIVTTSQLIHLCTCLWPS